MRAHWKQRITRRYFQRSLLDQSSRLPQRQLGCCMRPSRKKKAGAKAPAGFPGARVGSDPARGGGEPGSFPPRASGCPLREARSRPRRTAAHSRFGRAALRFELTDAAVAAAPAGRVPAANREPSTTRAADRCLAAPATRRSLDLRPWDLTDRRARRRGACTRAWGEHGIHCTGPRTMTR